MAQAPDNQPNKIDERVAIGGSTHGDQPAAEDRLGFTPYVDAVAEFLLSGDTKPPLTLSVEGGWGSGKTSFMLQLEARIRKQMNEEGRSPRIVRFNAWRHDKEEAVWAAFALAFVDALTQGLGWWAKTLARWRLFRLRYNWKGGSVAMAATVLHTILWIVFLGSLTYLWFAGALKLSELTQADGAPWYVKPVPYFLEVGGVGGLLVALWRLARHVTNTIGNPLRHDLKKHIRSVNYAERIAFIERFHEDFRRIVKAYTGGDEKVFVFVDDLDRCDVPKAADLMQALNLLIDDKNPLIFIMGMDREKIAAGIALKCKDLLPFVREARRGGVDGDKPNDSTAPLTSRRVGIEFGYEYIEKFVQLPFQVPHADIDERLDQLLEGLAAPEEEMHAITTWWDRFSDFGQSRVERLHRWWKNLWRQTAAEGASEGETQDGDLKLPDSPPSPGSEPEQRDYRVPLALGPDSDRVKEIVRLVAPALDNNPRRVIQFINLLRLQAYIHWRTGVLDLGPTPAPERITPEQLGKLVAINLRWPLFITDVLRTPRWLGELSRFSEPDKKDIPTTADRRPGFDLNRAWGDHRRLHELLGSGPQEKNGELRASYSLREIDLGPLVRAMPATAPPPQQLGAPSSPDKERAAPTGGTGPGQSKSTSDVVKEETVQLVEYAVPHPKLEDRSVEEKGDTPAADVETAVSATRAKSTRKRATRRSVPGPIRTQSRSESVRAMGFTISWGRSAQQQLLNLQAMGISIVSESEVESALRERLADRSDLPTIGHEILDIWKQLFIVTYEGVKSAEWEYDVRIAALTSYEPPEQEAPASREQDESAGQTDSSTS